MIKVLFDHCFYDVKLYEKKNQKLKKKHIVRKHAEEHSNTKMQHTERI